VLAILAHLFAVFGIIVPVVEAGLFVGVDVPLLFFTASGGNQGTNENKSNLKGASSTHGSLPGKRYGEYNRIIHVCRRLYQYI
jgi:hypothetical protein